MESYKAPGLAAAITLFIRNGRSYPGRDDYSREVLPSRFTRLDIWKHAKCYYPPLNDFYDPKSCLVRCNPPTSEHAGIFDQVLVEVAPQRSGMESELPHTPTAMATYG